MLAGFRSRWTTPSPWATWTARARVSRSEAASPGGQGRPSSRVARVPPASHYLARKGGAGYTPVLDAANVVGALPRRPQPRPQPEPQLLGRGSELSRQHHLQGRQPVEAAVPRLVDHPHAAATDLGQDLVVPDPLG